LSGARGARTVLLWTARHCSPVCLFAHSLEGTATLETGRGHTVTTMQLVVRYSHAPLFVRRCMARLSEQQLNPCCIARTITPHHCPQVLVDNVVREMVRSVRTFPARQLMMIRQVGCPRARRQLGQLAFRACSSTRRVVKLPCNTTNRLRFCCARRSWCVFLLISHRCAALPNHHAGA
jgi:hypothetical protein